MITSMQFTHFQNELCLNDCENEWIDAAKAGDLDAFNEIVLKYQDMLFRIAYNIFGDADEASDALQDAFISAFQHIHSFRNGSLKGWLIRIVVNKCGDQLRSARFRKNISIDTPVSGDWDNHSDPWFEVQDTSLPVESRLEAAELEQVLQSSLSELPMHSRSIVVLADIEELDYSEISRILDIPVGTVKSRLARARVKLRSSLLKNVGALPEKYVHPMDQGSM